MAFNKAKAMQEAEKLVALRKNAEAIKQYLHILDKDPADVTILNTLGDLYFRENNKAEALKCYNKLADAYTKDGFTVKAIAILKKIAKIDPATVDPILKMAELYILQGLNREAREQYSQAVEHFKKKNLPDRALETYRKIVALDPENRTYRTGLAELAEQMGRKEEAARALVEVAESSLRAGDSAAAEAALTKAHQLDPKSSGIPLLRARLAASRKDYAKAEKILQSDRALRNSPVGRELLLEAYLATHRVDEAGKLVGDNYREHPEDFSPLGHFANLCLEHGNVDAAARVLGDVTDLALSKNLAAPLLETLRYLWSQHPQHIATLELVLRVTERTRDEAAMPEVLGALARAYEQAGELEKAEGALRNLVKREPNNEEYRRRLRDVLEQQGKEIEEPSLAVLSGVGLEVPEAEVSPLAPPAVDEQAAMVKEALENSDLFSRYGLIDKAVAELEKVLAAYPEQVEIHRRIFEVCHRSQPARAGKAAEALANIYRKQGDVKLAQQYEDVVKQLASGAAELEVLLPVAGPAAPPVQPGGAGGMLDISEVLAAPVQEELPKAAEPVPVEIPIDLSPPVETPAPPPAAQELDLSADLYAFAAAPPPVETAAIEVPLPEPVPELPPTGVAQFNFDEARVEVDFYLSQGFVEEARNAVRELEERFPGEPRLAELRKLLPGEAAPPAPPPVELEVVAPVEELAVEAPSSMAPSMALEMPAEVVVPPPLPLEMPGAVGAPAPPVERVVPGPAVSREAPPPVTEAPPAAGGDLLGELAGDLAAGLEGFGAPPQPGQVPAPGGPTPAAQEASMLSGLLEELGEVGPAAAQDDPETHYNLGVAFREMGLLDEAIGEFQKVVKGAHKGHYPENYLQACSLLAVSFMDKGMPQIAIKWYTRALEFPDLDEESTLALQYDLGVAFEQAGDTRNALEKFSEVYSQNIDYRDVAEKIRALQKKAR